MNGIPPKKEGLCVGYGVGNLLGELVGWNVTVGSEVGYTIGCADGTEVGCEDGSGEGRMEYVGSAVGRLDG